MEETNKTKRCSQCEQELTLDRFYTYAKTGLPWAYCKSCHYQKYTKPLKQKWDEENPERKKEINRKAAKKWMSNNREKFNEIQRRWYAKNKKKQDDNQSM